MGGACLSLQKLWAKLNILSIHSTREVSHFETFPLKELADWNIQPMEVTREGFHFETSPLKDFAKRNEGSSEARIRANMHGTLTRKFVDLMAEYQEIQTKYKNKYRERVERQYRIVKPHATTEEIEEAFDSGAHKPQRGTALST